MWTPNLLQKTKIISLLYVISTKNHFQNFLNNFESGFHTSIQYHAYYYMPNGKNIKIPKKINVPNYIYLITLRYQKIIPYRELVRDIHGKSKYFAITHCLDYLKGI